VALVIVTILPHRISPHFLKALNSVGEFGVTVTIPAWQANMGKEKILALSLTWRARASHCLERGPIV
jgi:hypothetical protein